MELRHKGILLLLLLLHTKMILEDYILCQNLFKDSFGLLIHRLGILGR